MPESPDKRPAILGPARASSHGRSPRVRILPGARANLSRQRIWDSLNPNLPARLSNTAGAKKKNPCRAAALLWSPASIRGLTKRMASTTGIVITRATAAPSPPWRRPTAIDPTKTGRSHSNRGLRYHCGFAVSVDIRMSTGPDLPARRVSRRTPRRARRWLHLQTPAGPGAVALPVACAGSAKADWSPSTCLNRCS